MARDTLMKDSQLEQQRDQLHSPMQAKLVAGMDPVGDFMRGYGQAQSLRLQQRQANLQEMQALQQMQMNEQAMGMNAQDAQLKTIERRARLATEHLKRKEIMARMAMMDREYDLRAKHADLRMRELEARRAQDEYKKTQDTKDRKQDYKTSYAGQVFPDGKGGHVMFVPNPNDPTAPLRQVPVGKDSPYLKKVQGRDNAPLDLQRIIKNIKDLDGLIQNTYDPEKIKNLEELRDRLLGELPTEKRAGLSQAPAAPAPEAPSRTRADAPKKEDAAPRIKVKMPEDDEFFGAVDRAMKGRKERDPADWLGEDDDGWRELPPKDFDELMSKLMKDGLSSFEASQWMEKNKFRKASK